MGIYLVVEPHQGTKHNETTYTPQRLTGLTTDLAEDDVTDSAGKISNEARRVSNLKSIRVET